MDTNSKKSFWDSKPYWCQPWSIISFGVIVLIFSFKLLNNSNIERIKTIKEKKEKQRQNEEEEEEKQENENAKIIGYIEEEDEDEGPVLIYSIDQQIDDYIEYN